MARKLFAASAAIFLLGILSEVTTQYFGGYGYDQRPYFPQQKPNGGFQQQPQPQPQPQLQPQPQPQQQQQEQLQPISFELPPGVKLAGTEWICTNPKTNKIFVMIPKDIEPGRPQQPINNPQPNIPPINTPPTISQPLIIYPTQSPLVPQPQPQPQPNTAPPNINGEGLIDIRSFD